MRGLRAKLVGFYEILRAMYIGKPTSRQRICARCNQPIKRNHHWTAKSWDCDAPLNVKQLNSVNKGGRGESPELSEAVLTGGL